MTEEQYLMGRLADLQREYREAAQPVIKRLGEIEVMKPPAIMPVILEALAAMNEEVARSVGVNAMMLGIGIECDGKSIDPEDFYLPPPE